MRLLLQRLRALGWLADFDPVAARGKVDVRMVEILDLERVIARRAWPYERVMEHIAELEARGEPVAWLRLLACDIYGRPDEECEALLDAAMDVPVPAYGRYSSLLARCATRAGVAERRLEGLLDELTVLQRVAGTLRARGPSDAVPDVRALEQGLAHLDVMVNASDVHDAVERAARELIDLPGGGAYRAPALERVLRSALWAGRPDDEVERVLLEYRDAEVEPVRRVLVELDACRARDAIAERRLADLVQELETLEGLLRSAHRLRSAQNVNAGFPLHDTRRRDRKPDDC